MQTRPHNPNTDQEQLDNQHSPPEPPTSSARDAAHLRQVAHELLSPMTTLRLALQLARAKLQRGESIELSTLDRALRQVDGLVSLITQMRDAARLARNDVESTLMEPVAVRDLLKSETERLSQAQEQRQVSFECACSASLKVRGDRRALQQVLANLLDNAFKFSARNSPVRVVMSTSGSDLVFSVSDQGIGVPLSAREQVYEMFFRAPNASTSSSLGVGLGLFIAREIVVKHGGRIWCDSEPDRGSTFHVSLPLCPED